LAQSGVITVSMGEIKVVPLADADGEPPVLVAIGVGSCIAVCAYDRFARVAGMAHVVLPESGGHDERPGKYADTAIPVLLEEMALYGAVNRRITVAIAGGAQIFQFGGAASRLEIGSRNADAVRQVLRQHRVTPAAEDVGGKNGRSVRFHVENGLVRIKSLGVGERDLIVLGDAGSLMARSA
jgi:chemotaxis protein CheD